MQIFLVAVLFGVRAKIGGWRKEIFAREPFKICLLYQFQKKIGKLINSGTNLFGW